MSKTFRSHPQPVPIDFKRKAIRGVQEFIKDMTLSQEVRDSFTKDSVVMAITLVHWVSTVASRTIVHTVPRPSFLDWLFRREREITIHVEAADILKDPPPALPGRELLRIYSAESTDTEAKTS